MNLTIFFQGILTNFEENSSNFCCQRFGSCLY